MTEPLRIVFPLYAGMTHLDFTGPHQFLARVPDAEVIVASVASAPVTADGLTFSNLADLEAVGSCDVLCVPGGGGCVAVLEDARFMASVRRLGSSAKYVTSVCTGSIILGAAGFLEGKRAACHWAWRDMLLPFGAILDEGRVVRDGNVLTGGGVTAGIDFVLTLIAELFGDGVARAVQLGLEYAPAPPFDSGRPELAPPAVLRAVNERLGPVLQARREHLARIVARSQS